MNVKQLAALIEATAKVFNDGYDTAGADAATAAADLRSKAEPENIYAGLVDYSKFRTKTLRESAEEAAADADMPQLAEPVYLLLVNSWNDVLAWAKEVGAQ